MFSSPPADKGKGGDNRAREGVEYYETGGRGRDVIFDAYQAKPLPFTAVVAMGCMVGVFFVFAAGDENMQIALYRG